MKKAIVLAAVLALTGCASVISGNDRMVVVRAGTMMGGKAFGEAETYCQKYGKHAAVADKQLGVQNWTFDCVK